MSSRSEASIAVINGALDDLAEVDPIYLTTAERQARLVAISQVIAKAEADRLRVLAVSDDIALETGARSTAHWLAHETRDSIGTTLALSRVAEAVDQRWTTVRTAMGEGTVNLPQARVITEALDRLPTDLDEEVTGKGEAYLVAEAAHFGPRDLKRLGARLLEVIAPDVAEEAEHAALLAEERRARAATTLSFRDRGDGSTDLHARVPTPVAHRLRTVLESFTSPRRSTSHPLTGEVDRLPAPRQRGEAFCALVENLPTAGLPRHGGTTTGVMVMLDLDTLSRDLDAAGVAETSTGDRITAGHARRLACQAGIIPVVLGGKSEILDLGRTRRLFSSAQHKALAVRDRECTADGCSIPAAWCEAHHLTPWSRGGKTDLTDGKLLCSFHHHRAHDPGWETRHHPNGTTTFHRRT